MNDNHDSSGKFSSGGGGGSKQVAGRDYLSDSQKAHIAKVKAAFHSSQRAQQDANSRYGPGVSAIGAAGTKYNRGAGGDKPILNSRQIASRKANGIK